LSPWVPILAGAVGIALGATVACAWQHDTVTMTGGIAACVLSVIVLAYELRYPR